MSSKTLKNGIFIQENIGLPALLEVTRIVPRFGIYSVVIGILLIAIGSFGVFLPQLMSLEVSLLIAGLFIFGGVLWAIHAYKYSRGSWSEWLKPVLLFVSGGLMLFYPMSGIAAVGLLLAIYLLMDAFGSFTLAYGLRPGKGWGWMALNGVTSLLLAILFLVGWPATSLFLVGLFVAISLLFDGWVLLYLGLMHRKYNR